MNWLRKLLDRTFLASNAVFIKYLSNLWWHLQSKQFIIGVGCIFLVAPLHKLKHRKIIFVWCKIFKNDFSLYYAWRQHGAQIPKYIWSQQPPSPKCDQTKLICATPPPIQTYNIKWILTSKLKCSSLHKHTVSDQNIIDLLVYDHKITSYNTVLFLLHVSVFCIFLFSVLTNFLWLDTS